MALLNQDAYDFMAECEDGQFDHIICDPPYDMELPLREMLRICKGNIICFCKPENQYYVPDEYAFWNKVASTKNTVTRLSRFTEMILIKRRPTMKTSVFNNGLHWSNYTGQYDDRLLEVQIHPWQKPLTLMERLVLIYTNPFEHVFDPFAGVATTGVACQKLNRWYTGIEIDTRWYKIGCERLGYTNED